MIFSGWLFISFGAVLLACLAAQRNFSRDEFRLALLRSVVVWCGLLAVGTELLGIGSWITSLGVSVWWILVTFTSLVIAAVSCRRAGMRAPALDQTGGFLRSAWISLRGADAPAIALRLFLLFWFGALFAVALFAAPNNFDSLTYRLPRVMHWAAQGSVDHYPTEVIRQLDRAPFAEWVLLHIYQLRHNDHWFNLAQWAGFVFLVLAVHELTARYTPSRRLRYLAVVLAATMPMAMLQATSTQNNVLQALFFVLFVLFGLRCSGPGIPNASAATDAAICGTALGLAILTNTVNVLFIPFFALWFAWRLRGCWVRRGLPIALFSLLMVTGFFMRNQQLFHSPLGAGGFVASRFDPREDREELVSVFRNTRMSVPLYLSNVARNLVLQLAVPVQSFNEGLHHIAYHGHAAFGLTLEEEGVTQDGDKFMVTADRHEDFAGQPIHLILFFGCLAFVPFRRPRVAPEVLIMAIGIVASFALFCLLLEFQVMNPRVLLPMFALACVCIPLMLPTLQTWLAGVLAGASIAYAAPCLFDNYRRPAFGPKSVFTVYRPLQYFRDFPQLFPDYDRLIPILRQKSYRSLGLQTNEHQLHYPFWPMMKHRFLRNMRIYEVNVTNASRLLSSPRKPDAVLVTYPIGDDSVRGRWCRLPEESGRATRFHCSRSPRPREILQCHRDARGRGQIQDFLPWLFFAGLAALRRASSTRACCPRSSAGRIAARGGAFAGLAETVGAYSAGNGEISKIGLDRCRRGHPAGLTEHF